MKRKGMAMLATISYVFGINIQSLFANSTNISTVPTGDATNNTLYIVLLVVAAAILIGAFFLRKKKK